MEQYTVFYGRKQWRDANEVLQVPTILYGGNQQKLDTNTEGYGQNSNFCDEVPTICDRV